MPWEIFDPSEPNENVFFGGPGSPSTRQAPNFNGVSQYATFPEVSYSIGDLISFKIKVQGAQPPFARIIGGNIQNGSKVQFDGDGLRVWASSATYEIVDVDGGSSDTIIADGNLHTVTVRITSAVSYSVINSNNPSSNASYFAGIFYDYNDSLGNNFPMDDGWANNPTMRNTGTGADGAFINMTEASWVEVPV